MLYLAPPEFRRKYAAPIRAVAGIVLLAIGIAINSLVLLIVGGLFIVLAIVGFTTRLMSVGTSNRTQGGREAR